MALDQLDCYAHGSKFNQTAFCAPMGWVRWNEGVGVSAGYLRSYKGGSNFFAVVWQINSPLDEPDKRDFSRRVRLQVESPKYDDDPYLNDLKSELINALLAADLSTKFTESGFLYEAGLRTSYAQIRKNKATTVFTVLLEGNQIQPSAEKTIQVVHNALGHSVNSIVSTFATKLRARFGT